MTDNTLRYDDVNSGEACVIIKDKIVRFSKRISSGRTIIHLVTGAEILSYDSINTLETRFNSV